MGLFMADIWMDRPLEDGEVPPTISGLEYVGCGTEEHPVPFLPGEHGPAKTRTVWRLHYRVASTPIVAEIDMDS
jgi:hypothetical protein